MTDDERQQLQDRLTMAQIDKIAFDTDLARRQERWDVRKFIVTTVLTAILATAAAVAAGVGVGNLIWAHRDQPAQTLSLPPGTIITTPSH